MSGSEVAFVQGSGNQFEVKYYGEAEGEDGKPVVVLQSTTRTTLATAQQQVEIAQGKLAKAQNILKGVRVAAKAEAKRAADALAKEAKKASAE